MITLKDYVGEALGQAVEPKEIQKHELGKIPFYIRSVFHFQKMNLLGHDVTLAEAAPTTPLTVHQIEKQFSIIHEVFALPVVFVSDELSAITRKRLIVKSMNFIVPGKQMFLPALLLDLKETFRRPGRQKETVLPSAQALLLYRILNRKEKLEEYSFKELAALFHYTPMVITKAAENLCLHHLCEVRGTKEKHVQFPQAVPELWEAAVSFLTTPVLKRIYTDALPEKERLFLSNTSALPMYSDVNESRQQYYAIGKERYYAFRTKKPLLHSNETEGTYCLEIWKYDPGILNTKKNKLPTVDPLSLYLSMRNSNDERIEMALEQLLKDVVW
jgi:hypothetical protein